MNKTARIRALLVSGLLAVVFSTFSYRLIHLQVDRRREFADLANQTQILKQDLPATRGSIRDIHNEILARDLAMKRIVVDGSHIKPGSLPRASCRSIGKRWNRS